MRSLAQQLCDRGNNVQSQLYFLPETSHLGPKMDAAESTVAAGVLYGVCIVGVTAVHNKLPGTSFLLCELVCDVSNPILRPVMLVLRKPAKLCLKVLL